MQILRLCPFLMLLEPVLPSPVQWMASARDNDRTDSFDSRVRFMPSATVNLPATEINALHELYNATQGWNWEWHLVGPIWAFIPSANPCSPVPWQGITCIRPPPGNVYYVEEIDLDGYGLNGTLPDSIGSFSHMASLILRTNYLYGTIPDGLQNALSLSYLSLDRNNISGTIPNIFGSMPALKSLSLSRNQLSGQLPVALTQSPSLLIFIAAQNAFVGTIPKAYGNWTKLQHLDLSVNALTGTLPAGFASLSQLKYIILSHNRLTGQVPNQLGNGTQLEDLYLEFNQFSGPIPIGLGRAVNLSVIYMQKNYLTGTIPVNFGDAPLLGLIELYDNMLTGSLPTSLSLLPMDIFEVHYNQLTGHIPPVQNTWANLSTWKSDGNYLTGTLPVGLCNCSVMVIFSASSNYHTGTLRSCVQDYHALIEYDVNSNLFSGTLPAMLGAQQPLLFGFLAAENLLSGTLPASLGTPIGLDQLELSDNFLTGSIPGSLAALSLMTTLELQDNQLTGTLEGVFNASVQTNLNTIQLSSNRLTGTLPSDVFLLPQLRTLVLADNCFHGTLPAAVCNATQLSALVLDGLSSADSCLQYILPGLLDSYTLSQTVHGSAPTCVYTLPQLHTLHLSGNAFTGSLPADQMAPALSDLSLSHNVLTGTIPADVLQRTWLQLDLSYNRLGGRLPGGALDPGLEQGAIVGPLYVRSNRLSGAIPGSLQERQNVSVLGTNLFSCNLDGSDLPQHDSDTSSYQCGSAAFDVPYYIWLVLCGAVLAVAVWCWYKQSVWYKTAEQWLSRCADSCAAAPHLHRFLHTTHHIAVASSWVTLYAVVVLLPAYAILSHYHGMLQYSYAWTVSASFLSGSVPTAVVMVLLVLLIVLVPVAAAVLFLRASPVLQESHVANAEDAAPLQSRMRVWASACLYVTLNAVVVVGVNAAFVYIAIYQSSGLLVMAQVLIAFFKLLWGQYGTEHLRKAVAERIGQGKEAEGRLFLMQLAVAITNTLVIPCLVAACISPSCFYDVFIPPSSVTTSYNAPQCELLNKGVCVLYSPDIFTLTYNPPYRYSYQCSSSLVTYYAPAYVNLCLVSTFVVPAAETCALFLHKRTADGSPLQRLLRYVLPTLLREPEAVEDGIVRLRVARLLTTPIASIALLLTFGVVFPPLAVALVVAVVVAAFAIRVKIGRFLTAAVVRQELSKYTALLNRDCAAMPSTQMLHSAVWMLITVSCWFFTLFLFDTLGDAVGFEGAYWVLIVMPLMPAVLYSATYLFTRLYQREDSPTRLAADGNAQDQTKIQPNKDDIELAEVGTSRETSEQREQNNDETENPMMRKNYA